MVSPTSAHTGKQGGADASRESQVDCTCRLQKLGNCSGCEQCSATASHAPWSSTLGPKARLHRRLCTGNGPEALSCTCGWGTHRARSHTPPPARTHIYVYRVCVSFCAWHLQFNMNSHVSARACTYAHTQIDTHTHTHVVLQCHVLSSALLHPCCTSAVQRACHCQRSGHQH